jgi:hypothetical protein
MSLARLIAGRNLVACGFAAGIMLALGAGLGRAADPFPFDQELLLDAAPMRPVKRVPILNVAPSGNASIGLWCKTVAGRVTFADKEIRIESAPLPDALPQYMSDGQCTPERMQADVVTLDALTQVTEWRKQGGMVVLLGPTTLKFRPSDH